MFASIFMFLDNLFKGFKSSLKVYNIVDYYALTYLDSKLHTATVKLLASLNIVFHHKLVCSNRPRRAWPQTYKPKYTGVSNQLVGSFTDGEPDDFWVAKFDSALAVGSIQDGRCVADWLTICIKAYILLSI